MSTTEHLNILGLCGSLREASLNRMALNSAGKLLPANVSFHIADWSEVPPFDADVMTEGFPTAVLELGEKIRRADGVIISTPEYNFSIPGMFKNALDWVSRLENKPFAQKPVAILSASAGPLGGARVQYELRRVFHFLDASVLGKPEVFIGNAQSKFAKDGMCTDEITTEFMQKLVVALLSTASTQ